MPDSPPLPLAGLRVVELASNLAGPWAAQILADLGADVVKVEHPAGGDPARTWGPPFVRGDGAIFAFANRNKRSVALDLTVEADRGTLDALLAEADVLVEALRPGAARRLGYGWEAVAARHPSLLYASVLAYGEAGPLRDLPGYDSLMQAHAGLISITGPRGGPAVRVGTSVVDLSTGLWLVLAVLAGLRERDRTGRGMRVTASLYDVALSLSGYHLLGWLGDGTEPGPLGNELGLIAPYGTFPTSDGELMIAAGNDALFRKLCAVLGLEDLPAQADYATNPARVRHREALNALVGERTRRFPTEALLERLRAGGVPAAPIRTIAEAARDPQTAASGMLAAAEDDPDYPAMPLPIRWNGARSRVGRRPPRHPGTRS